jgi:WD40 repeat protein
VVGVGVDLVASSTLSAQEPKSPLFHTATKRLTITQNGIVWCVAFSPDGKTLSSGSDDKTIKLWNVATGKKQASLKGHTDCVWSLAYSPDGKTGLKAIARLLDANKFPCRGQHWHHTTVRAILRRAGQPAEAS